MGNIKDTYHWWFLSGLAVSLIVIFLNYVFNKESVKKEAGKVILCPDYVNSEGMKFAGYGKMELPREGIFKDKTPNIFTWSLDKEKTELYIVKSNTRNFGVDIDIQYKIVEVYYKDVESK